MSLRAKDSVSISNGWMEHARSRTAFRRSLLKWYATHARDLPWRRTHDPYAIWVSEIMLQQTQVATVIGYFERFLRRFPEIGDLAAATEQEVLKLWEGLGYYRRARQLHAAARKIVEEHGGKFPRSFEDVRNLPGIGRYTAGAISSFAFDQPRPIVEANTQRLYARLLGLREDPRSPSAQQALWRFAEAILPARFAGSVNQALIELGSQICRPRNPDCDACPVQQCCAARALNLVSHIPAASKKVKFEDALEVAVVVRNRRGGILLRRRGERERWAGMWDFPRGSLATGAAAKHSGALDFDHVRGMVNEQTGAEIDLPEERFRLRHGVTRFRIELVVLDALLARPLRPRDDLRWVTPAELAEVALSVSARKIATSLIKPSRGKPSTGKSAKQMRLSVR